MRNFSNTYIFVFATVMVFVVAMILSFAAMQLQPLQKKNERTEKMQNILSAANIDPSQGNIEDLYNKYIVDSYVISTDGEKIEGISAFSVDMKKELFKMEQINNLEVKLAEKVESPFGKFMAQYVDMKSVDRTSVTSEIETLEEKRELPVYEIEKENGNKYYVFPLRGKGLWGPIWGYVSLSEDFNEIYGADFDHKSETPGLGAEIKETWFEGQFKGKLIYRDNEYVAVDVVKGGADPADKYAVDGVSGGTITSEGLEDMIREGLRDYQQFFELKRK